MFKHKFNIFPEMSAEEMKHLTSDLWANGFDKSQPIILFEGQILDGWNRYLASETVGVEAVYKDFEGSEIEAINFVMRTNKRRNLTSSQWAALAVEAEEIILALQKQVEEERRFKQSQSALNGVELCNNKLLQPTSEESESVELTYEYDEPKRNPNKNSVATKLAEEFGTNRTYVADAKKIKEKDPETFEKIKSGETTITKAKQESKPTINDILDDDRTDEHTRMCKDFGGRFQKIIREFESLQKEFSAAFGHNKFPLDKFAKNILTTNLQGQRIDAKKLKEIVKCPNCKGASCDYCSKGYITADQTESVLDMANYKGVTFDQYMEAKNGTSTVSN